MAHTSQGILNLCSSLVWCCGGWPGEVPCAHSCPEFPQWGRGKHPPEKLAGKAKTREIPGNYLQRQNSLMDNSFITNWRRFRWWETEANTKVSLLHLLFPGSVKSFIASSSSASRASAQRGCGHSRVAAAPSLCHSLLQHGSCCVLQSFRINLLWQGLSRACRSPRTHPLPWDAVWVSLQWLFAQAAGKCCATIILCTGCRNVQSSTGGTPSCTLFPSQCSQHCLFPRFSSAFSVFLDAFSQRHPYLCLVSQLWHLDGVIRWLSGMVLFLLKILGGLNILEKLKIPLVHQIQSSGA